MTDKVIPLEELGKRGTVKVYNQAYVDKLEEKISVLLSCKNCPENKGGLLCQKEYEDKCLAQKIQYIKELKEENTELKEQHYADCELVDKTSEIISQLNKAKEIIKELLFISNELDENTRSKAEQFLKEIKEK